MAVKFDCDAYDKKVQATLARSGGLKGVLAKRYIPVTQWTLGDYCVLCRDRRAMLDLQLAGIAKTLSVDTDWIPYLEPWHGVGVYAEAFGCPFEWREGDSPWTHPIVKTVDDLKKLQPPTLKNAKMLNYVLDTVEYFDRETQGRLPIALTDTQSPLDNATLVCDTTFYFMSTFEYPDHIKQLLRWITDLMIESSKAQRRRMRNAAQPGHIMWSPPDAKGISISEDNLVMIGPDFYAEFAEPYNIDLARAFGGLAVHSCGVWHKLFEPVSKTPGLFMADLCIHRGGDPNPNRFEDVLRGFAGKNTLVQIRTCIDNDNPETSFAWIDQLRGPGFPMVVQIPFNEDPKIANRNYAVLRKKLDALLHRGW